MAGYGNRNAPDITAEDLKDEHSNTRYERGHEIHAYTGGHDTYGSGATGGAGFGNKSAPDPEDLAQQHSETRFGSHKETGAYSGGTRHGSGSSAGAGYGNKTGNFDKQDSTLGKIMEKVGHVTHNEGLAEKGRTKREAQGLGAETVDASELPNTAN